MLERQSMTKPTVPAGVIARRVSIRGVVQGVGFRPFVIGWRRNTA